MNVCLLKVLEYQKKIHEETIFCEIFTPSSASPIGEHEDGSLDMGRVVSQLVTWVFFVHEDQQIGRLWYRVKYSVEVWASSDLILYKSSVINLKQKKKNVLNIIKHQWERFFLCEYLTTTAHCPERVGLWQPRLGYIVTKFVYWREWGREGDEVGKCLAFQYWPQNTATISVLYGCFSP